MWARSTLTTWCAAVAMLCGLGSPARAQQGPISVEIVTGHAGYIDEVWDNRLMIGGNARLALTRRWALGPEVIYLAGPDDEDELLVTGSATYDLVGAGPARRIVPFVVVSAGVARRSSLVGRGPDTPGLARYTTTEATASGGLGVRIALTSAFFVSGDARLGVAPERRLTASVGWRP